MANVSKMVTRQGDYGEQHQKGDTSEVLESPPREVDNLPGEENSEEIPRGAQSSSQPRDLEAQIQNGDSAESDLVSESEGEESDVEIRDLQRNFDRLHLTPPAQATQIRPIPAKRTKFNRMASLQNKNAETPESEPPPHFCEKKGGICRKPFSHVTG
ncbi:uncharacterized protein ACOB7L_005145 [Callospermophilus lateralis]